MNERLEKIRQLLSDLEDIETVAAPTGHRDFSALELPLIIQEIVDDLQPLTRYESAFYWYLNRHSIAEKGNPRQWVGTRGLQSGMVKSSRSEAISLQYTRETLAVLEKFSAIRKEGEENRDGTLYRILIPDEIEACRTLRTERKAAEPKPEVAANEIDSYHVRENRIKVHERNSYRCRHCEKQLTQFTATLGHVKPITEEGDNSLDSMVTACLICNSRKHHRPVGDFLADR